MMIMTLNDINGTCDNKRESMVKSGSCLINTLYPPHITRHDTTVPCHRYITLGMLRFHYDNDNEYASDNVFDTFLYTKR